VNFVRSVFASTLVLALSTGIGGCDKKKPEGTTPPTSGGDTAATGGDASSGGDSGGSAGGSGGDSGGETPPPAKACEAKVADAPTALFDERVLIRPPVNVELIEDNPMKAEAVVSGGFVSACEATVDRMSLFVYENDTKKSAKVFADEFLENLARGGFSGGTKSSAIVETNDEFDISVEFAASGGNPATVMYLAVRRRHSNFFIIVYQTRPGEFPALKPTFTASAKSLLVKKPS